MGIAVPKMSAIVNRTTRPIDGMFNGQPLVIPPGYRVKKTPQMKIVKGKDGEPDTETPVLKAGEPQFTVEVIGAGPNGVPLAVLLPDYAAEMVKRQNVVMGTEDPENFRDVEYLIGCEAWGDNIGHVEQTDAAERFDRSLMSDEAQQAKITGSVRQRRGQRNKFTDTRNYNPAGIRGDVG